MIHIISVIANIILLIVCGALCLKIANTSNEINQKYYAFCGLLALLCAVMILPYFGIIVWQYK